MNTKKLVESLVLDLIPFSNTALYTYKEMHINYYVEPKSVMGDIKVINWLQSKKISTGEIHVRRDIWKTDKKLVIKYESMFINLVKNYKLNVNKAKRITDEIFGVDDL